MGVAAGQLSLRVSATLLTRGDQLYYYWKKDISKRVSSVFLSARPIGYGRRLLFLFHFVPFYLGQVEYIYTFPGTAPPSPPSLASSLHFSHSLLCQWNCRDKRYKWANNDKIAVWSQQNEWSAAMIEFGNDRFIIPIWCCCWEIKRSGNQFETICGQRCPYLWIWM